MPRRYEMPASRVKRVVSTSIRVWLHICSGPNLGEREVVRCKGAEIGVIVKVEIDRATKVFRRGDERKGLSIPGEVARVDGVGLNRGRQSHHGRARLKKEHTFITNATATD